VGTDPAPSDGSGLKSGLGPKPETASLDSSFIEWRESHEPVSKDVYEEFKEAAVRRLELGASVAEVARACEVNPNVLHRWRRELREYAAKAFPGEGRSRTEESRIAELERKVGRQAMEIDFLRQCLQRVEEQRRLQALTTRTWSTRT